MKKFRELVRETRVEDEGLPSEAALSLKDRRNKEAMPKLKESSAEELLAVAKKVSPNAKISTPETRQKDKESYEKRTAKYAGQSNVIAGHSPSKSYPLGGYDPKSNRSYSEEYESVPASKALQKAHEDERKKRGLPDPDYYLKLRDQKKKEIEDMKKEETELDEVRLGGLARIKNTIHTDPKDGIDKIYGSHKVTGKHLSRDAANKFNQSIIRSNMPQVMSNLKKQGIKIKEEVKQPTGGLKDACWKGYTAVGMKTKNGRKVPNCVPKEEVEIEEGYYKNQEIERQETERLAKQPPFTPDKPKKQVVAGKKPEGYSTARHLARQAMQKYKKPVKESLEESRRAEIVKEIIKKKKNEDKFNAEPIISDTVTRNT